MTIADLEAYHKAIVSDRLRAKPEDARDVIVWTWNACQREVVRLAGCRDSPVRFAARVYIRPWSDFPPTLKADVDAFLLRLSGADLSEDGPCASGKSRRL